MDAVRHYEFREFNSAQIDESEDLSEGRNFGVVEDPKPALVIRGSTMTLR
jgi:hypothetical protein